ncbi:putative E3 ubiquitin-protein ligase UNKL isoform X1 [Lethenteron reissneri]|uniref:putative E3 ubiquitin-protein ligase UNKL isoform X1 n=1 Tax=Lethenteron reissneri TaxID=7753 RepID=UPI002AB79F66|nr:putative E3 ubiquitin-protein ligase UNKL isoform X1 [Lethenteron reissneri]
MGDRLVWGYAVGFRRAGTVVRYLKEFRTEQCSLFLQHKCTQHRPYTCFHWHFLNQRRRRPIRRRDGTFNYSPDVYCSKYDETTGVCLDGDECQYLHRSTGDTERRYHLRYYKTSSCIHETDARGHCVKNGVHCAFAHGPQDLRPAVYDIRDLQAQEAAQNGHSAGGEVGSELLSVAASQTMIERALGEDQRWQDSNFVLANYKTDPCKKPPRLCRQGYACPYFHSSRDRRRSPRLHKYRSVPCPSVKQGEDWCEPDKCEVGDDCQFSHTRPEQQFHPEIYKSTKCNDMQQLAFCPRGPFCAFAHLDQVHLADSTEPALICAQAPSRQSLASPSPPSRSGGSPAPSLSSGGGFGPAEPPGSPAATSPPLRSPLPSLSVAVGPLVASLSPTAACSYQKAPGYEREDQAKLQKQHEQHTYCGNLQEQEDIQNTHSLLRALPVGCPTGGSLPFATVNPLPTNASTMNAKAMPFYPPSSTVDSVIGSALADLDLHDYSVTALERDLGCGSGLLRCTGSPGAVGERLYGERSTAQLAMRPELPRPGLPALPTTPKHFPTIHDSHLHVDVIGGDPSNGAGGWKQFATGGPLSSRFCAGPAGVTIQQQQQQQQRLSDASQELWHQPQTSYDAWRRQAAAEEAQSTARAGNGEPQAVPPRERGAHLGVPGASPLGGARAGTRAAPRHAVADVEMLSLPAMRALKTRLEVDLELLEKAMQEQQARQCLACEERPRRAVLRPCQHYVLCEECAPRSLECPYCRTRILGYHCTSSASSTSSSSASDGGR